MAPSSNGERVASLHSSSFPSKPFSSASYGSRSPHRRQRHDTAGAAGGGGGGSGGTAAAATTGVSPSRRPALVTQLLVELEISEDRVLRLLLSHTDDAAELALNFCNSHRGEFPRHLRLALQDFLEEKLVKLQRRHIRRLAARRKARRSGMRAGGGGDDALERVRAAAAAGEDSSDDDDDETGDEDEDDTGAESSSDGDETANDTDDTGGDSSTGERSRTLSTPPPPVAAPSAAAATPPPAAAAAAADPRVPVLRRIIVVGRLEQGEMVFAKPDFANPGGFTERASRIRWYRISPPPQTDATATATSPTSAPMSASQHKVVSFGDSYRISSDDIGCKLLVEYTPRTTEKLAGAKMSVLCAAVITGRVGRSTFTPAAAAARRPAHHTFARRVGRPRAASMSIASLRRNRERVDREAEKGSKLGLKFQSMFRKSQQRPSAVAAFGGGGGGKQRRGAATDSAAAADAAAAAASAKAAVDADAPARAPSAAAAIPEAVYLSHPHAASPRADADSATESAALDVHAPEATQAIAVSNSTAAAATTAATIAVATAGATDGDALPPPASTSPTAPSPTLHSPTGSAFRKSPQRQLSAGSTANSEDGSEGGSDTAVDTGTGADASAKSTRPAAKLTTRPSIVISRPQEEGALDGDGDDDGGGSGSGASDEGFADDNTNDDGGADVLASGEVRGHESFTNGVRRWSREVDVYAIADGGGGDSVAALIAAMESDDSSSDDDGDESTNLPRSDDAAAAADESVEDVIRALEGTEAEAEADASTALPISDGWIEMREDELARKAAHKRSRHSIELDNMERELLREISMDNLTLSNTAANASLDGGGDGASVVPRASKLATSTSADDLVRGGPSTADVQRVKAMMLEREHRDAIRSYLSLNDEAELFDFILDVQQFKERGRRESTAGGGVAGLIAAADGAAGDKTPRPRHASAAEMRRVAKSIFRQYLSAGALFKLSCVADAHVDTLQGVLDDGEPESVTVAVFDECLADVYGQLEMYAEELLAILS